MQFCQATDSPAIRCVRRPAAVVLFVVLVAGGPTPGSRCLADDDPARLFENVVRPLLHRRCLKCHGELKQSGGLRVDSRAALLKGGDSGPAMRPGNSAKSLLVEAVRQTDGFEMPPDDKLDEREIAALTEWIDQGAVWPAQIAPGAAADEDRAGGHWAFQPVRRPAVPKVTDSEWIRTPVDAFILARLRQAGLSHSPPADRRTLIRRLSYTLTGLPPTTEEVDAFVTSSDPHSVERLIDRLLDSPPYGEHWARHWLDVARYSDTKGYVYAREERFWVHAWAYRDWVVRALNDDIPYDRFLLLQLAADQVADRRQEDLAAMGFLTLGRRFLGVKHDIIDDRIDVVCRGTMGLTVGCARCHDHKYDPIPTADYYSLYGVFDSCREQVVPIGETPAGDEAYQKELKLRQDQLQEKLTASRAETAARVRSRVADYLHAQTELEKYPPAGFDQIFTKDDLLPAFVRRWERYLHETGRRDDPVFTAWHAYARLPDESFQERALPVTDELHAALAKDVNRLVREAFASPPRSFREVVERYGQLFAVIDAQWQEATAGESTTSEGLSDAAAEQLRQVLYGPHSPCAVPDEPIVHTESYFDSGTCTQLWKLQGEVDRWIIQSQFPDPHALTLIDRPVPNEPRVHRRGNPLNVGEDVPRRFLSLLAGEESGPFQRGSGRLELAHAIVDPSNPLTARVLVNRVWAHHFGRGLVSTTSDFGLRAEDPSHPELLDWLTSRFVAEGWSLKQLHRVILNSSTFRQSSDGPNDPPTLAHALATDPDNRLLWRMNANRLSFEQFRDSMLAASGNLDLSIGGKPVKLFERPYPTRRTLYGLVDRQFLPGTLRMFDFANPDLHIPQRNETTVPQQALFFLNHPTVLDGVRSVVDSLDRERSPEKTVQDLFRRILQREPTDRELRESLTLVSGATEIEAEVAPLTAADWQYGYGAFDESSERITGFTPLPHFTGSAWQGGTKWPDQTLGWVQLTAEGGHPGNDRQHAAIRRWTAPRPMTVSIQSRVIHEAKPGDGIRALHRQLEQGPAAVSDGPSTDARPVALVGCRRRGRDDRFRGRYRRHPQQRSISLAGHAERNRRRRRKRTVHVEFNDRLHSEHRGSTGPMGATGPRSAVHE